MQWSLPGTARRRTPSRRRRKPAATISLAAGWQRSASPWLPEGIALDVNGYISEGAGENLFEVKDGVLFTPPFTSSALPGITRDAIIKLAKDLGIEVREQVLSRESLYRRMKSSCPVPRRKSPRYAAWMASVGAGRRGPVTKRIQEAFFGLFTGETEDKWGWLDPVSK